MSVADLPAVNASLNGLSATFLLIGYIMIKRGNRIAHRNCMIAALTTSVIFLISYLTYHSQVPSTRFEEPKAVRPFYLAILLTHTILAAVIVPLVLITLNRAWKGRFELHRKIARWTWPLWMYVSITGVVIYLLLYQIYPQHREGSSTQAVAVSKQ